jgi:acyl-CoA synthetase (AMP-forming)/AMP-acid ligase II
MLAERKVPEFWTIIDELPCTAAGKVDRKALRLLAC